MWDGNVNEFEAGSSKGDELGSSAFYSEGLDPMLLDAKLTADLASPSERALLDTELRDFDEDAGAVLAAPLRSRPAVHEFDWTAFKVRDSFVLRREEIPRFLDIVIAEVSPTLRKQQAPASANALFLALRYMFYCMNNESFMALSAPICRRICMALEEHGVDLAYYVYWLANVEVLHYLLQRDKSGLSEATEQDLQPMLEQLTQQISESVMQMALDLVEPLLAPCVLDYDSVPEYGKVKYRDEWRLFKHGEGKKGDKNGAGAVDKDALPRVLPPSYETLMKHPGPQRVTSVLSSLLVLFQIYGVHPLTQAQIIARLLYKIGARMFNTVLRERRYLSRRRAIQIRLNVSVLEDWCRNHNFRPQAVEGHPGYKSLVEIGRTFLAPLVQLLAWLQTFSGFGDDFTNVVSTLQELRALNPKQLLRSAENYRFETREMPLTKEYKDYLRNLAQHYHRNEEEQENDTSGIANTTSFVAAKWQLPVPSVVFLDLDLDAPDTIPSLQEELEFWGVELPAGVVEQIGGRYVVPYISEDFAPKLAEMKRDSGEDTGNANANANGGQGSGEADEDMENGGAREADGSLEDPGAAVAPVSDELDMGIAAWTLDESPASVW